MVYAMIPRVLRHTIFSNLVGPMRNQPRPATGAASAEKNEFLPNIPQPWRCGVLVAASPSLLPQIATQFLRAVLLAAFFFNHDFYTHIIFVEPR